MTGRLNKHLSKLDIPNSMRSDGLHPRMLRDLAKVPVCQWQWIENIYFLSPLKCCGNCGEGSFPITRNGQMLHQPSRTKRRRFQGITGCSTWTTSLEILWCKSFSMSRSDTCSIGRWLETPSSLPPMMTLLSQWVRGEQWIFLDFKKAFHIAFLQAKWWNMDWMARLQNQ